MAGINEVVLQENNMDSIELENIFMNIFLQCDDKNDRQVEVSTLIKFISPFVESNDEHLFELKKILDPLDIDPIISYDQFANAMKIWTDKFNNQLPTSFVSENSAINRRLSDHGPRQSTPTKESIERGTHKTFDCELNISNVSSYSYAGSVQSACDPIFFNEQINELRYQNKKLQDLLDEVRGQLAVSEELNNNMQHDIDKLTRSRLSDQKVIEDLQKLRIEFEKEREEHDDLVKNHNSIIKSLNFYKKENSQLRKSILKNETENHKNQEVITSLRQKESKQTNQIEKYNNEIEIKNNEIMILQEKLVELNTICSEKESYIKEMSEELQTLKYDNNALQKCLDDVFNKNSFIKPDFVKSGKKSSPSLVSDNLRSSTPMLPSQKTFKFDSPTPLIFNSPKMLNMLSSPVSPINNNSSAYETFHSSKSIVIEQQLQQSKRKYSDTRAGSFYCISPTLLTTQNPIEKDALNHTSSSIESESSPQKQSSVSLNPEIVCDDSFHETSNISRRSETRHESLQEELIKASFSYAVHGEDKMKLIQLEQENENLVNQIHHYIEENNNIKQNIAEISTLNTELQNQILLLNKTKIQNEKEIQKYVEENNNMQKNLNENNKSNSQLRNEISVLINNKIQIEKEVQKYIEENSKINKNILEINNLNTELKNQILLLNKNKIQNEKDIQKYVEENNNLQKNLNEKNKSNSQLRNEISVLINNKIQIEKEVQKYIEENNKINKNILEINNLNTELKNQILLFNNNKIQNEKEIQKYVEENNNLQKNLNEKNKLNSRLQNEISVLNKNKQKIEKEVQKYIEENSNINKNLLEMNNLNAELKNQITLLTENQENSKKLQEQLVNYEQLQKDNEEISTLNVKLKSDILSMKTENKRNARFLQKINKLENEIFDEKSKSEKMSLQYKALQLKITEVSSTLKIFEVEKNNLEKQLSDNNNETRKMLFENKELKTKINELSMKISNLELEKQQLEKNLSKEESQSRELKSNIKELFSKISALEQTKQVLEEKLTVEELNGQELTKKLNKLTPSIEKTEQPSNEAEVKINSLSEKLEISEQVQTQLKEKLNKAESVAKEFKLQINEVNKNIEILEQTNHHLENQLIKEENKYQSLTAKYNEIEIKNSELNEENNKTLSKNKIMLTNITNLEQKIQNFRKANIDLTSLKNELERNQKVTLAQYNSLVAHINFTQEQIKECTDLLGKNTLLATRIWQSHLESAMDEMPVSDLTDESSLSGVMLRCEGLLTEDVKNLKNQTRLTGILLLTLAKIKENQILDCEDEELSDVFIPESRPLITHSVFCSNSQSFYIPNPNFSISVPSSPPLPSMSPDCEFAQSEMTDEDIHFSQVNVDVELADSGVNVSSAASTYVPPESAVQNGGLVEKENEIVDNDTEEVGETSQKPKAPVKQHRSMSEGTALPPQLTENGDITLFPNLQDNVLESLGLQNGEHSRNRSGDLLTEEEIEAKFQTLALIFAIDSKTLAQRRELQKRQRDLADDNFATEVAKLEHGIHRLAPLCVDAEIKELVTALLTRLNIIVKAAQRISISTQVYGGVQQEFRVAAAVNLMLVHLRNVQQQRDTVKRQLQCTKKMLQESNTNTTSSEASTGVVSVVSRRMSSTANGRVVTRRRASIASLPRPLDSPSASGPAGIAAAAKRAVRRISADAYSEQSVRPWDSKHRPDWIPLGNHPLPTRLSRPSRIELGLDLSKIHEASVETILNNSEGNEESDSDVAAFVTPTAVLPTPNLFIEHQPVVQEPETFCDHIINILTAVAKFVMYCWNRWMKDGTTREIIFFVMIVLFCLSTIVVLNIMIMSKFLEQGTIIQKIPWGWLTWEEFWDIFFDFRNVGPRPY